MSVRASERDISNIEFLKVTRDIEVFFVTKQSEKPKKFRYFFSEYLIKPSANAYTCAKMANSIYVDDVETKQERRHLLQNATYHLQALVGQIDILYAVYKSDVLTNKEIETISGQVKNALQLIKGVIKSDKKRYKDII